MKTQIPLNPQILKWARSSLGLSREDVALRLKKTENEIRAWEEGYDSPTYSQLEKLAFDIYKRPVAIFFFPEVPAEDTPHVDFRTLPESVVDMLPPQIIKMYRKAKVYQLNLAELYDNLIPTETSILQKFELSHSTDLQSLTSRLREVIQIDVREQKRWHSYDIALKEWRQRLEALGVFVFKDAFKHDDYSGFCLYDDRYPVVFVNNSMPKARQIFTLFHELAHLLFKSGGVDVRAKGFFRKLTGDYSALEVKCNEFAGEMLLPLHALMNENLDIDEKTFEKIANKYKVSREVVLRKYLNLSLITKEQYRAMADKWIAEAVEGKRNREPGGNPYYTKMAYLGDTYINMAFGKYIRNQITVETLADYLGMSVNKVPTFENYVLG